MTELSVPWPLLEFSHFQPSLKLVTWASTERFFEEVNRLFPKQYREVLSMAQKVFHPDRWTLRKVLESVRDEKARTAMREGRE